MCVMCDVWCVMCDVCVCTIYIYIYAERCDHPDDEPCFWERDNYHYRDGKTGKVVYNRGRRRAKDDNGDKEHKEHGSMHKSFEAMQQEKEKAYRRKWGHSKARRNRLVKVKLKIASIKTLREVFHDKYFICDSGRKRRIGWADSFHSSPAYEADNARNEWLFGKLERLQVTAARLERGLEAEREKEEASQECPDEFDWISGRHRHRAIDFEDKIIPGGSIPVVNPTNDLLVPGAIVAAARTGTVLAAMENRQLESAEVMASMRTEKDGYIRLRFESDDHEFTRLLGQILIFDANKYDAFDARTHRSGPHHDSELGGTAETAAAMEAATQGDMSGNSECHKHVAADGDMNDDDGDDGDDDDTEWMDLFRGMTRDEEAEEALFDPAYLDCEPEPGDYDYVDSNSTDDPECSAEVDDPRQGGV